mgnify:FL=1
MLTNEERYRRRRRRTVTERRRLRRRRRNIQIIKRVMAVCLGVFLLLFLISRIAHKEESPEEVKAQKTPDTTLVKDAPKENKDKPTGFRQKKIEEKPEFEVDLLTPNPYSRPQLALEEVKGIVVHYTGNPGTTAAQNRSYFESLKDTKQTKASSHFVIGLEGEVVQCIPSTEMSYASNNRNSDTLSIECCHKDESGEFTQETYDSLVGFVAWLCGEFDVPVDEVIRHYDVTGKECPRYFALHEDAWQQFKKDVQEYLDTYGKDPK